MKCSEDLVQVISGSRRTASAFTLSRSKTMRWQPIATAPVGQSILMWWRPVASDKYPHPPESASPLSNNRYAESCVIGQISVHEDGKWWDGREYKDIWHVTHWMPLPKAPWAPSSDERTLPGDTQEVA